MDGELAQQASQRCQSQDEMGTHRTLEDLAPHPAWPAACIRRVGPITRVCAALGSLLVGWQHTYAKLLFFASFCAEFSSSKHQPNGLPEYSVASNKLRLAAQLPALIIETTKGALAVWFQPGKPASFGVRHLLQAPDRIKCPSWI
jgi:hypothetical protein